jgi:hypothetical protein
MTSFRRTLIAATLCAAATVPFKSFAQTSATPAPPKGIQIGDLDENADLVAPAGTGGVTSIIVDARNGSFLSGSKEKRTATDLQFRTGTFERVVLINVNPLKYTYKIVVGDSQVVAEASPATFFSLAIPGLSFAPSGSSTSQTLPDVVAPEVKQLDEGFLKLDKARLEKSADTVSQLKAVNRAKNTLRDMHNSYRNIFEIDSTRGYRVVPRPAPSAQSTCPGVPNVLTRKDTLAVREALLASLLKNVDSSIRGFANRFRGVERNATDDRASAATVRGWTFVADSVVQLQLDSLTRDSVLVDSSVGSITSLARGLGLAAGELDTATEGTCKAEAQAAQIDAVVLAMDTIPLARRLASLGVIRTRLAQDARTYANIWTGASRFWLAAPLRRYDKTTDVVVHITRVALVAPEPQLNTPTSSGPTPGVAGMKDVGATTVQTTVTTTATVPQQPRATAGPAPAPKVTTVATGKDSSSAKAKAPGNAGAAPTTMSSTKTVDSTQATGVAGATARDSSDWALTVHYATDGMFSISAGLMYGALRAPQYGVVQRRVAAPPGAAGDTIVSRIAVTDNSGYRVVPAITLGTRVWRPSAPWHHPFVTGLDLTIGAGVYPKSGDFTVSYLAGVGVSLLNDRFSVVPGVYVGVKNFLVEGTHVGDVALGSSAPTGSRLQAEFGLAVTYRVLPF